MSWINYEDDDYFGLEREEEDERDPDDCMDCGMCDACIEQSRAYAEEMEQAIRLDQIGDIPACDCEEDMTKLYGGHKKDCPNAIPF